MRCSNCTASLGGMTRVHHPPFPRRAFLRQAGRWAGVGALAACALRSSPATSTSINSPLSVTVALAAPHAMAHLPLLLAHTLGYLQAEGLVVEWFHPSTENQVVSAVLRGRASVAACSYAHTLQQHARGGDLQSFLLQLRTPQEVVGASLKTLGHYRSPADLAGRRVGVLASAAPGHLVVGRLLQSAGFKPGDASLVVAETADELLNRYRAGELDVLSVSDPVVTLLEQRGEIRILADTRSLHGTREVLGGPVPGGALCAPSTWVSSHPAVCQALANGVVRALKWLQTAGPADLIKALPDAAMGADRALYLAAFDKARGAYSPDGLLSADAAQATFNLHARLDPGFQGASVVLPRTYTNQFAAKAKSRYRA